MEDKFKDQFAGFKKQIDTNLDLLVSLVEQAGSLSDIVESITGTTAKDKELRDSIIKSRANILKKIDELFESTKELNETYIKYLFR